MGFLVCLVCRFRHPGPLEVRHTARAEEGTQTPSLPRTSSRLRRAPGLSATSELEACPLASGSPSAAFSGLAGLHSPHFIGKAAHTFTPPHSKDADELLLLPIFQQTCPEKTKFSDHRFSGSAFGCSSFLTFVSRRSLQLSSAPPVNPACAALRSA